MILISLNNLFLYIVKQIRKYPKIITKYFQPHKQNYSYYNQGILLIIYYINYFIIIYNCKNNYEIIINYIYFTNKNIKKAPKYIVKILYYYGQYDIKLKK